MEGLYLRHLLYKTRTQLNVNYESNHQQTKILPHRCSASLSYAWSLGRILESKEEWADLLNKELALEAELLLCCKWHRLWDNALNKYLKCSILWFRLKPESLAFWVSPAGEELLLCYKKSRSLISTSVLKRNHLPHSRLEGILTGKVIASSVKDLQKVSFWAV